MSNYVQIYMIFSPSLVVDRYRCVSAFWNEVTCVLKIPGDPVAQSNTTYSLKFTQTNR